MVFIVVFRLFFLFLVEPMLNSYVLFLVSSGICFIVVFRFVFFYLFNKSFECIIPIFVCPCYFWSQFR